MASAFFSSSIPSERTLPVLILQGSALFVVLQGRRILGLHLLVVTSFPIRRKEVGPGNHAERVEGILVARIERDDLLVPFLRVLEVLGVVVQAGNGFVRQKILRIVLEHVVELVHRGRGILLVLGRFRARNVLLHVGGGEIQAGRLKTRIEA